MLQEIPTQTRIIFTKNDSKKFQKILKRLDKKGSNDDVKITIDQLL